MAFVFRDCEKNRSSFWKELYGSLTMKDRYGKAEGVDERVLVWNVYGETKVKKHVARFNWVHTVLKYRFAVPLLLVFERVFGKRLDKEVPVEAYNTNLRIFNDSFEAALKKWSWEFMRNLKANKGMDPEIWKNYHRKEYPARMLRAAKDTALTLALNDTAYREFLNIWMFEASLMMNEEYAGRHPAYHVFYTDGTVYDVNYYYVWQIVKNGQFALLVREADK